MSPIANKEQSPQYLLRSIPLDNLTWSVVKAMLKSYDFFCVESIGSSFWGNERGKGIKHEYSLRHNDEVVYDAATGLMWERAGAANFMSFEDAPVYIAILNSGEFSGYRDWRLPTLEEAMSLMEPEKRNEKLYIDPIFHNRPYWIWTSDTSSSSSFWFVSFFDGLCMDTILENSMYCVRAVR